MKRNLLKGMFLISAVALSSCSTVNKVSKTKILDDDVYYTRSQAGDSYDLVAQYVQPQVINPVRNDDYYYYGDYESRINRFSYFTPFDYDDDFYYNYTPYGYDNAVTQTADYDYEPVYDDLGVYSAYDFGYGYYGGYDNFGFGIAYSTFVYGGGSRANYKKSYSHTNKGNNSTGGLTFSRGNAGLVIPGSRPDNSSVVNNGLTFSRANSGVANNNSGTSDGSRPGGNYAVYPGRPGSNAQAVINSIVAPRNVRPESQNPRPVVYQPATERAVSSAPPPSSNNNNSSSSGSSSSGSSNSSGGGGRPVRP
jgi:hypothetical protein